MKHLESLSRQAEEICEYLDYSVRQLWKTCVSVRKKDQEQKESPIELVIEKESFFQSFPAVRKLLLQKCIGKVRGGQKDLTSAHLQSVSELFDRQVGKQIDLPGGVAAKRTYDGIEIIRQTQSRAETGKAAPESDAAGKLDCVLWKTETFCRAEEIPQKVTRNGLIMI